MEADRSGGGPNTNSGGGGGGNGAGRNANGPKAAPSQATSASGTGAIAAAAAGAMPGTSQARELQDGDAGMTLPGILHFIQYEWGRFQAEKCRWEAERDELRVKIKIKKNVVSNVSAVCRITMLFLYCSFLTVLMYWLENGKRFMDETMLTANSTP